MKSSTSELGLIVVSIIVQYLTILADFLIKLRVPYV